MIKIITTQEKQTEECLNIRYIFTFDVPLSKRSLYDNEPTMKVSGIVSWQNGTNPVIIKTDLERRYNEFQQKLNKEEIINPSVNWSYDGIKWL